MLGGVLLLREDSLSGEYVNIENETDILYLYKDKTFSGIAVEGKYRTEGNKILFEIKGTPFVLQCIKVENGFDCENGDRYRKK